MADIELDLATWGGNSYHLLNSLVVPRPIAWVSTRDEQGRDNLAPHSYFTVVSTKPPMVAFTSVGAKDTLANVRATGEFVLNVATVELLEAVNTSSSPMPREEDEFAYAGLTKGASVAVAPPYVVEAPAHLECVLDDVVEKGDCHLVIGRVLHVRVAERVWSGGVEDGRVDVPALDPLGRLAGSDFVRLGEVVRRKRPGWPLDG